MSLSELQNAVYSYLSKKSIFAVLLYFSKILILIYPIYLLLTRLPFLNPLTSIIGYVSIILYFGYIMGIILCFAKNEMLMISIAFWLRSVLEIIDIFISISGIIGLIIYVLLGWLAFKNINS